MNMNNNILLSLNERVDPAPITHFGYAHYNKIGDQLMIRYTLYFPIYDRQQRERTDVLEWVQSQILNRIGGLTTLPKSNGFWIDESGIPFPDTVIPIECVTTSDVETESWFSELTNVIAVKMEQKVIFLFRQVVYIPPNNQI